MKLSIVVPCYNCDKYLLNLIDSFNLCMKGREEDFEIILIDDASNTTYNFFHWIMDSYPALNISMYKNLYNVGVGNTRQIGLNKAKGEWVLFFDQDDIMFQNPFDFIELEIINQKVDIIYSDYKLYINSKLAPWGGETEILMHGKIYRTEFLKGNNISFLPELRNAEDLYFNLVCLALGTICRIKDSGFYMQILNKDSQTQSTMQKIKNSFVYSVFDSYQIAIYKGLEELYKRTQNTLPAALVAYYFCNELFFLLTYQEKKILKPEWIENFKKLYQLITSHQEITYGTNNDFAKMSYNRIITTEGQFIAYRPYSYDMVIKMLEG